MLGIIGLALLSLAALICVAIGDRRKIAAELHNRPRVIEPEIGKIRATNREILIPHPDLLQTAIDYGLTDHRPLVLIPHPFGRVYHLENYKGPVIVKYGARLVGKNLGSVTVEGEANLTRSISRVVGKNAHGTFRGGFTSVLDNAQATILGGRAVVRNARASFREGAHGEVYSGSTVTAAGADTKIWLYENSRGRASENAQLVTLHQSAGFALSRSKAHRVNGSLYSLSEFEHWIPCEGDLAYHAKHDSILELVLSYVRIDPRSDEAENVYEWRQLTFAREQADKDNIELCESEFQKLIGNLTLLRAFDHKDLKDLTS